MRVRSTHLVQVLELWFNSVSYVLASIPCMPAGRALPGCLFPAPKTCSYGLVPGIVVLDSRVTEAEMENMDDAYLAASVAMYACCCCSCQSLCATTAASQVSTCLATTSGRRECRCGQSTGTAAGSFPNSTQLSLSCLAALHVTSAQ
jgi:hypothetical protein